MYHLRPIPYENIFRYDASVNSWATFLKFSPPPWDELSDTPVRSSAGSGRRISSLKTERVLLKSFYACVTVHIEHTHAHGHKHIHIRLRWSGGSCCLKLYRARRTLFTRFSVYLFAGSRLSLFSHGHIYEEKNVILLLEFFFLFSNFKMSKHISVPWWHILSGTRYKTSLLFAWAHDNKRRQIIIIIMRASFNMHRENAVSIL